MDGNGVQSGWASWSADSCSIKGSFVMGGTVNGGKGRDKDADESAEHEFASVFIMG